MIPIRRSIAILIAALGLPLAGCLQTPAVSSPSGIDSTVERTAEADYRLALRYMDGNGVDADEYQAVRLLMRAAGAGHAEAQFELGRAYALGRGVQREPAWAVLWYGRAAEQGHVEAQYRLGLAYAIGEGIAPDLIESYKWLTIAGASGHERAARSRVALAGRMIREEMLPAERAAARWAPPRGTTDPDQPLVRFVQFALTELGYDAGGIDGVLGRRTRTAIAAFARRKGLRVNVAADNPITTELVLHLRQNLRELATAAVDG